jgi:molybdenum cofactor synthesis domain-containing protein
LDQKEVVFNKAAVLAVGTELTTGQTLNSNASWISAQLVESGIDVIEHRVVADERELIRKALLELSSRCDLLIVTGGLGPTADDFTREVISEASGRGLRFDLALWDRISERLTHAGIRVAENNRQQCYFPADSVVIENPAGTAAGFRLNVEHCVWVVLPGPPREVEAIWKAELGAWLAQQSPGLKKQLYTWQCLGKSEAELGEMTERVLAGSGLITGYRAHRPYIEIKVWADLPVSPYQVQKISELEQTLMPWLVQGPGEMAPLEQFFQALEARKWALLVSDSTPRGLFAERLLVGARKYPGVLAGLTYQVSEGAASFGGSLAHEPGRFVMRVTLGTQTPWESYTLQGEVLVDGKACQEVTRTLRSPFRVGESLQGSAKLGFEERILRWAVEAALVELKDWIQLEGFPA